MFKSGKYTMEEKLQKSEELKLGELHKRVVDTIIAWLKENNLSEVDEFTLHADGVAYSTGFGYWTPATDSTLTLRDKDHDCITFSA